MILELILLFAFIAMFLALILWTLGLAFGWV
jgi:hypothetical protein